MKYMLFLLFISIGIGLEIIDLDPVNFNNNAESKIKGTGIFKTVATYSHDVKEKFLYIFPKNYDGEMYINKGLVKIFFKEISSEAASANYLDSDYSTLDFNSGIYIEINKLNSNKANIFFISYNDANLKIQYKYADDINFPKFSKYTNFQFDQFILEKGLTKTINYEYQQEYNEYLIILSKTSLKNIEVTVNYKNNELTKDILANLYPNGCSLLIDTKDGKIFDFDYSNYIVTIKNKNKNDEILLLGYMHHMPDQTFTNQIVNGYQIYLEGNDNKLFYLPNEGNNQVSQYFIYQTYSKEIIINFKNNDRNNYHHITEYNSMINNKYDTTGQVAFNFEGTPKRNALYIQFIDYSNIEVAQKSFQALVTGSPKSMLLPSGKSMYNFLPKERKSNNINYYLRSKTPNDQKMYVSFKLCSNYPEECVFTKKDDKSILPINNIGLWYSQPTKNNELQLIYVYCEEECSYDILMTYDNDPLFMFPENNYTKFLNDEGQDIFILPVFEFLSRNESIYIDLSIISGKAELILYNNMDKFDSTTQINVKKEKINRKQSYTISKNLFTNADYYKKDIFAVVKGDKNTFYNLMYGSSSSQNKILDNNRIITELVSVFEEDYQEIKNFTFINLKEKEKFFISITTPSCKSKIFINEKEQQSIDNHHLIEKTGKGQYTIKIILITDNFICKKGYEEEVILYAYNSDNTNILLSENTLVNTSYSGGEIIFKHIFRPNIEKNADNSFNVEIERLSKSQIRFQYKLERISFNVTESKESSSILSSYILAKKNFFISSIQIDNICGSLSKNEICSLSLIFTSNSDSEQISFSLFLNKNGNIIPRHLIDETLINTVNPNSIQYYYIDIFKSYDTEILINSYGQDLQYSYKIKKSSEDEGNILPFDISQFKPGSNNHKIIIETSEYCLETFCRIYLGVLAIKNKLDKEVPTTFEISYLLKERNLRKTEVKLPLNYFTQYTLDTTNDIKEITYLIQTYDSSDLLFELYTIKENDNDINSEVIGSLSGQKFISSGEKYRKIGNNPSNIIITIEPSSSTVTKSTFKFRVSSIGKSTENQIIPILPYSSEKCEIKKKSSCYYTLDISPDNEAEKVYFYIPESEYAYISINELDYGNILNPKSSINFNQDYKINTKDKLQRSNWFEYIIPKEKNSTLLIRIASQIDQDMNLTLYSSFYNKPEVVTLNHGEKKIFTIESNKINEMKINIKKTSFSHNKYKINIHAVKGDGVFKVLDQLYPLGINGNNKEHIIIVIDELEKDLEIIVNNIKDEKENEFTFTIDYMVSTMDHLFNELKPSVINSYKFIKPTDTKLSDISFYIKVNKTKETYQNINMNIKIYTNISTFEVNSYIVDEDFIKEKSKEIEKRLENSVGKITTYIQGGSVNGGELTLSKLEIESKVIDENKKANKQLYIYITFKQRETKDNKVKIDIYPYDISNNLPLERNELFIEKLKPETRNYQLLLVKSDFSSNDMIVEYLSPLSNKYKMAIEHDQNKNEYFANSNETDLIKKIDNLEYFGKNKINLDIKHSQDSKNLRYLLFNVFNNEGEKESKEDLFIFKYRNQNDEITDIYNDGDKNFNVEGTTANITFTLDVINPKYYSGNTILIFNAYNEDDVKELNLKEENMALYLFFSKNKKPIFTMYKAFDKNQVKKSIEKSFTTTEIKSGGTYYFTCVSIIEDNEREEYLGYKSVKLTLETSDSIGGLLDYMKNHIFATVLMIIIVLFVIGMMVNMCRNERKDIVSINVSGTGQILEDMSN